jgi:hypothetical protein
MASPDLNIKLYKRSLFEIFLKKIFFLIYILAAFAKQVSFPKSEVSSSRDEISGLLFLDYFYVPNSNIKLYTGLNKQKEKTMISIGDESNSCVPSFTKISNVVKSVQGSSTLDEYYYLCAKDSNLLYQMPSNLNFVRRAQNYATDSNLSITGTRCTSSKDESLIIIAYIGQDSIYIFQFQTNTFTKYLTFPDELILEYASSDDRQSNLSFYLLTKNISTKKIYFKIMTYPDEPIYTNFEYLIEQLPLYENIRISKNTFSNQLLIFTFNSSKFKFYFIDSKTGVILNTNSDNSFMSKQVIFEQFEFVDFSELFLYRLTSDDGEHYGTGDLNSWISLFDKIDYIYGIFPFIDNSQGNSLIAISTSKETLQTITCAYADESGKCVKKCSDTASGYIWINGKNNCLNCLINSKVLYSRYCLDECPIGMKPDTNGVCMSCSSIKPYYDPKISECVDSCPLYSSPDKDKVCIYCFSLGLFYYPVKKSCVLSCPSNWIYDNSNGNCLNCLDTEKYYCDKPTTCCDSCPVTKVSDEKNVCYTCKSIGKFYSYSSKTCIDSCSSNSVKDDTNMTCDICKFKQPQQYYLPFSNICVDNCPSTMISDENNICYTCKSINKYYSFSSNSCVDICPNNSVKDLTNNTCDTCELKSPPQFYLASINICLEKCPQYYVVKSGNICQSCSENNEYFYNDKCYSSCPNGCEVDKENHLCIYCKASNKFLYNSKCVDKCPDTYFNDEDNKCYSCKDLNKFYLTNTGACIEKCDERMTIDNFNNKCTDCQANNQFLSNNTCVNNCPNNNILKEHNVCYSCKENKQYYLTNNHTCIASCNSHMRIDDENKECTDCGAQFQFLSKNECKNSCPDFNLILTNNVCYSCKDNNQFYLQPIGQCIWSCETGMKIDSINKVCTSCLAKSQYFYNNDCLTSCPQYYIADSKNICYNCFLDKGGKFLIDNTCVTTCPENSIVDNTNHLCSYCADNHVYLPITNKCIDKCPEFYVVSNSKRCYQCLEYNEFYYNGNCLKSCPTHCAVETKNNRCDCCVDSGKFLYNNNCEIACPEYSQILQNNVCKKCSLEANNTFYLDLNEPLKNNCVASCPEGSTIDNIKKYCKFCSSFNKWLFGNDCVPDCNFCKDGEKKICKYCNDCQPKGQIYEPDTKVCVDNCKDGSILNDVNECVKCSATNNKYYLNNTCLAECPKNHIYKSNLICSICKDYIFKNNCIPNCPYTYGILGPSDRDCVICLNYSKYRYNSECRDKCPENTITDNVNLLCQEKHVLNKCQDTCNYRGKCNETNNFCDCEPGSSGRFCEISIPIGKIGNFTIKILNEYLSKSESNLFGIKFNNINLEKLNSKYFNYLWNLNEKKDESAYMNGSTEKFLKIKPFTLLDGTNTIRLQITNSLNKETYKSLLVLEIKSIDVSKMGINILYFSKNGTKVQKYAVAMKDYVSIQVYDKSTNGTLPDDYQYKFYYEGRKGEELPISDSFLASPFFSYNMPITKKIIVHIKDNRGQQVKVSQEVNILQDQEESDGLSQITNDNNSPTVKFLILDNYLNTIDKKLSQENVTTINNFLKDNFDKILTNSSSVSHNSILSVINQMVENQVTYKTNNTIDTSKILSDINDIVQGFTNRINSIPPNSDIKVSRDDLNSYYRTVDTLFCGLNSIPNQNTDQLNSPREMDKIKESINSLNQYLARDMLSNERVVISTKNFDSYLEKPGYNQKIISLQEVDKSNNNFSRSSDFTLENKEKSSECNNQTLLCVDQTSFETLKNSLPTKNIKLEDITVFTINFNNSNLYNGTSNEYKPLSFSSVSVGLYDSLKNSSMKDASFFNYEVDMKIQNSDKNTTNNSACITFNTLKKPTFNCKTYFDYKVNKTICKCKGTGEVVNFYNNTLANMAKLFQFPEWSLDLFNPLSLCLVYGTGMIVITFSIILLLYDYYDDRNFLKTNVLDDHQNIQNDFKDVIGLCHVGTMTFALYISMYNYPFFAVFSMYNYNQPRFMRFTVEFLSILMSITFSLLQYYKTPFEYKQIYEDIRDNESSDWDYENLPSKISDILSSIVYTIFATIVMSFVIIVFSCLMKWGQLMSNIWQHRKNIIQQYVRECLIRPLRLPEKWKMLRNRILAFNRICGNWIIKKNIEMEKQRYKKEIFKNKDEIKNNLQISKIYF